MKADKMERERKRLLEELKRSGKSIAAFSKERGISVHRLYAMNKSEKKKQAEKESGFVRIGGSAIATVVVDDRIKIEVAVGDLNEVLAVLGVRQ